MKPNEVPIKSTWREAIGVPLTDRRITNRIKEGWYGLLPKLRLLARSSNKATRSAAKEQLKRYEGVPVCTKRCVPVVDITEFV